MNKIIRLSKANIKRHKKETILLGILIMLCAVLMAASVATLSSIKKVMPQMVEESGCYRNFVEIDQNVYSNRYLDFLENNPEVTNYTHTSIAVGEGKIKDSKGSVKVMLDTASFISDSGERLFEKFDINTSLSYEQLKAIEHPIYLGKSEKEKYNVEAGEDITLIFDKKEFTFTVTGFYEPGLWLSGAKAVVSAEDLRMLEEHLDRYEVIGFDVTEKSDATKIIKEFKNYIKEASVNDTTYAVSGYSYKEIALNNEVNMSNVSKIIFVMAGVIIIAVIVMIRFRIVTDISEQMVSIGVLEAIGYKSKEIALTYIFEYMLVALAGCILAFVPSIFLAGYLINSATSFIHYSGQVEVPYVRILLVMLGVLLFVGFIAMTKALFVNKFPPVMALRKGIETHHFKKTFLPLEKTKGNIHIRLAFKEFLQNTDKKVGFMLCITVTTIMVIVSFFIGTFFGNADNLLSSACGHELADVNLEAMGGTDPESFAEELRSMPEVDRVLLGASSVWVNVTDTESLKQLEIYKDYSETESIIVTKGRLPKHDNEIAITVQGRLNGLQIGQIATLEYGKVKRDYIVCGEVNSINNPSTLYMTEDGFKNLNPLYSPDSFQIFLRKDIDQDAFVKALTKKYGEELTDIKNKEVTGDTLEERIRSAAEIKMAEAMSESGVSYMEYSIRVGDEIITGSTHNMKIKSLKYDRELNKEAMEMISQIFVLIAIVLMMISGVVVVIILSILMSSAIRKQYKELGIMKSLGYTSRELKLQMAFKIIPQTVIGVVIGSVIGVILLNLIGMIIVKITVSVLSLVLVDLGILLFSFLCAYLNAKKIGKISVCELMTE